MHDMVVLDPSVITEEEDHKNVQGCEQNHLDCELLSKDSQQHNEDHRDVECQFNPSRQEGEVLVTETVDHKYPFIKKLCDGLGIPPIGVELAVLELSDLGHGQHDIVHDEVVQADMDVEEKGSQLEEEFREGHGVVDGGV